MKKISNLIKWAISILEKTPHALLALGARIFVGLQFYKSGILKFDGWFNIDSTTFYLFKSEFSGVPLPPVLGAYLASYSEVIFSVLIIVGLGARFGALGLLGMTLVIQTFVYPEAYVLHGLWAVSLLYIIKYGAGALSVDCLIKRYKA